MRLLLNIILIPFFSLFFLVNLQAQLKLTLQECLDLALKENTTAKINEENIKSSRFLRKSMLANFFPKFSANGAYLYNSSHAYIFPDRLKTDFGTIGIDGINLNNSFIPQLMPNLSEAISNIGAGAYQYLYDMFDLDMTHVFAGQIGVIQPIWLGGRIIQSYKMAKSLEKIANIKNDKDNVELKVSVEEAYWRVISVNRKLQLAKQYVDLLNHLLSDVSLSEEEGMLTKSDVLKVRVKLNEAQSSLAQAEDGLILSKMALCQLIGLPLKTDIELNDKELNTSEIKIDSTFLDKMDEMVQRRKEIQMLEETQKMAKAGVKFVSAGLQPNILASANYITSNPNIHNSFTKDFYGFFSVGVVMNVPIAHADQILALKASKHKAKTVELQLQEAKEKIQLQATQSFQKLLEAKKHLDRSNTAVGYAEENLRFAKASYEEGMITMSDLMMAQTAWQQAKTEQIDAYIEVKMAEIVQRKNSGNFE